MVLFISMVVGIVGAVIVSYLPYRLIRAGHGVGRVLRYMTIASAVFVVMAVVPAFLLLLGFFGMIGFVGIAILVAIFVLQYLLPPYIYASRFSKIYESDPNYGWLVSLARGVATRAGYGKKFDVYLDPQSIPNAYAIGNELKRMVVVTKGLLDLGLSREELEAVLAHEIGHLAHRDNAYAVSTSFTPFLMYIIGIGAIIFGLTAISTASQMARASTYRDRQDSGLATLFVFSIGAASILLGALMVLISIATNIPILAFSRLREHLADIYSVDTLKNNALATALTKIENGVRQIIGNKKKSRAVPEIRKMLYIVPALSGAAVNIFSTHPPTEMRILVIETRLKEITTKI